MYLPDPFRVGVRKIDAITGIITTIAGGSGISGYSGDGGPTTAALLGNPARINIDHYDNLYIADNWKNRIRMIVNNNFPPLFSGESVMNINDCAGVLHLDTLLSVQDSNVYQKEIWSLLYGPFHGSAAVADTIISNGGWLYPAGLTYTPATGFHGTDTLKVRVSDGIASDTTTLIITVDTPPYAASITGADTVCKAASITLTDTAHGGVWSASNGRALVAAGIVIGVSPGPDTINYSITNTCGTATASHIVTVKGCTAGFANTSISPAISIFPNPTDGAFTVSIPTITSEPALITITNMVGEKIKEVTTNTNTLQQLELNAPTGIYFLNIKTNEGVHNVKVVKK